MNAADLKSIFSEARPVIEQMIDAAEVLAGLREVATAKGLDWSQIKALVKAQVMDERDGGDGKRVKAIIERADNAAAYSDMLGLAKMNEKNYFAKTPEPHSRAETPAGESFSVGQYDGLDIPPFLRRAGGGV